MRERSDDRSSAESTRTERRYGAPRKSDERTYKQAMRLAS